ncbi:hypothetical protein T492DRAFT_890552 [Pavlovales sp. CCMP2436]|nr:hypothetical protein T492DRAFT_890552 [Pavlovales sp. CCMP2436]
MAAARYACLLALAVAANAHAAGALHGHPSATHLVWGRQILVRSPVISGARARALLATLGEGDAPPGLRAQVSDRGRFRSTRSVPVRGRKQGTADEWMQFESCAAAARELGPGFNPSTIGIVASGKHTHTRGWTFEYTQQYEEIEGKQWRSVMLGGVESGAHGTEDEWRHFESCAAAARELGPGFNPSNLEKARVDALASNWLFVDYSVPNPSY